MDAAMGGCRVGRTRVPRCGRPGARNAPGATHVRSVTLRRYRNPSTGCAWSHPMRGRAPTRPPPSTATWESDYRALPARPRRRTLCVLGRFHTGARTPKGADPDPDAGPTVATWPPTTTPRSGACRKRVWGLSDGFLDRTGGPSGHPCRPFPRWTRGRGVRARRRGPPPGCGPRARACRLCAARRSSRSGR